MEWGHVRSRSSFAENFEPDGSRARDVRAFRVFPLLPHRRPTRSAPCSSRQPAGSRGRQVLSRAARLMGANLFVRRNGAVGHTEGGPTPGRRSRREVRLDRWRGVGSMFSHLPGGDRRQLLSPAPPLSTGFMGLSGRRPPSDSQLSLPKLF